MFKPDESRWFFGTIFGGKKIYDACFSVAN
jgi:hypothetical protein